MPPVRAAWRRLSPRLVGLALAALPFVALPLPAQSPPPEAPPTKPITSMGQPPTFKPYAGAAADVQATGPNQWGGNAYVGVFKDLLAPAIGIGLAAESYLGGVPEGVDGGFRGFLALRAIFLQFGVDYNLRLDQAQYIMSAIFPLQRGGFFHAGGEARVDWIPKRNQTLNFGVQFPFGSRWTGKTRPYKVDTELPRGKPPARTPPDSGSPDLLRTLAELQESTEWVFRISFVFTTRGGGSLKQVSDTTRVTAEKFRTAFLARERQRDDHAGAVGEIVLYHQLLDQAFGLAAGAGDPARAGRLIANQARAAMFGKVLIPYDLRIGQYKKHDGLWGLGSEARAQFARALEADGEVPAARRTAVLSVFDTWLGLIETVRAQIADLTRDSRMVWLPLALGITPEQHDTQAELDSIIGHAVGRPFTGGNEVAYINAQQASGEFLQSILQAKDYHVLWIHDYRGLNNAKEPDQVGYETTVDGYLTALVRAVRRYDETGTLPAFIILLDQNYYDANGSRLWMNLLERPLTHRAELPPGYESWSNRINELQDSLRAAVAASTQLQARAREAAGEAGAERWIEKTVKVHVSITNPADLSFRTRRLLGLPFASDVLMRDHRKIFIRDVTEEDPGRGAAMYTGIGVGQWYASDTWEDRAIIVRGPAALYTKEAARTVLLQQGFSPEEIPPPLRPQPLAANYQEQVRQLEEQGWTADALLTVNQTGFYPKDASFAQMALYDLMPPGGVIWVPDSIWNDILWIAQLTAAALRGCHVFVVAPAEANAPSAAPMTLSRTEDMFTRLLSIQDVIAPTIRRAGGDFRVGLYTRTSQIGIPEDKLRETGVTYRQYDFLRAAFPFPDSVYHLLQVAADTMAARKLGREQLVEATVVRLPNMHRKTQFFATRATLDSLARTAALDSVMREVLTQWATGVVVDPETNQVKQTRTLIRGYDRLPEDLRTRTVMYMTVGSLNKDARGLALDGESMFITSGPWALAAYTDFFFLFGSVTWLENQAQLESLLGPYSGFSRWMGRRLKRIL